MTNKEILEKMEKRQSELQQQLVEFRKQQIEFMENVNKFKERETQPFYLEKNIGDVIPKAIYESIFKVLTGDYRNPLKDLAEIVISKKKEQIETMMDGIMTEAINLPEFKEEIRQNFIAKLSKRLIAVSESNIEQITNDLRKDSVLRSKITLVVNGVIEEYLKEKGK